MRNLNKIMLFVLMIGLLALAFPTTVNAKGLGDDKLVFGGTFVLSADQTLDGNLAVFGGAVTLEKGSIVNGDVAIIGGALSADGRVNGNVSIVGGSVSLNDNAVINGDVTTFAGTLNRSNNAKVTGRVVSGVIAPFHLDTPPAPIFNWPRIWSIGFEPFRAFLNYIGSALLLAALATLFVLFWPKPAERIAQSIVAQPVITGGLGLLTVVVTPALIILLTITIILIPISLLAIVLLAVSFFVGWASIGLEVGKRLGHLFKGEWHPALYAGLGTLALSLVVNGVGQIPCIGWVAPFLVSIVGLGGVLVTRFGTQVYPGTLISAPTTTPSSGAGQPSAASQTVVDVNPLETPPAPPTENE